MDKFFDEFKEYDLLVSQLNTDIFESYFICYNKRCINNGIIVAKPKNKTIMNLIQAINKNPDCKIISTKMSCITDTTGPTVFSKIIEENLNDKIKILNNEYLEPCIINKCNVTDNTYLIHKQDCTWCHQGLRDWGKYYYDYKEYLPVIASCICIFIIIVCLLLFMYSMKSYSIDRYYF